MNTSENLVLKRCGYCDATGKVPEDGFDGEIITCPVCNGLGTVNVPEDTVLHIICDGKGKLRLKTPFGKQFALCPDCHGTGWFTHPGF